MAATTSRSTGRAVTSSELRRNWRAGAARAIQHPLVVTTHGKPSHVLLAYTEYVRLRAGSREVHRTDELPVDLADAILLDLTCLRSPRDPSEGDTVIG